MQENNDEYSAIEPIELEVEFNGRTVKIKPLTVGQIPGFARALRGLVGQSTLEIFSGATTDADKILDLLAFHGDSIIEAVSIGARIPVAEIQESGPDELIRIAACVLRVNSDFFARRLAPAIAEGMKARRGAGQTPPTP